MFKKISSLILILVIIISTSAAVNASQEASLRPGWENDYSNPIIWDMTEEIELLPYGELVKKEAYDYNDNYINLGNYSKVNIFIREKYNIDIKKNENETFFGHLLYGKAYGFPVRPIAYYPATNETTFGEIAYFQEGAVALLEVDQAKRQGGPIEVYIYKTIVNNGENNINYIASSIDDYNTDYVTIHTSMPLSMINVANGIKINLFNQNSPLSSPVFDFELYDDIVFGEKWTKLASNEIKMTEITWYDFNYPTSRFIDVADNHWAKWSINKANELGLVSGIGDNKYGPNMTLTKAQVLQMMYNMWLIDHPEDEISNKSSNWYDHAVDWAKKNQIIKNTENSTFDPNSAVTREQACVYLYRMIENKRMNIPYTEPDIKVFSDLLDKSAETQNAVRSFQKARIISGMPDGTFKPDKILSRAEMATIMDHLAYRIEQCDKKGYWSQREYPEEY